MDYIGIADELREATGTYTAGGGRGEPAPGVTEEAKPLFFEAVEAVRSLLPAGIEYGSCGYLQAEHRLTNLFLLVKHLDECR